MEPAPKPNMPQNLEPIEAYVSREAVDAVTDGGVLELGPMRGMRYEAFTDPSGGAGDSFALAIAHKQGELGWLDLTREVRLPFSPEAVVFEFAENCRRYGITTVKGDRYAGEGPREAFAKQGIKYELSDDSKGLDDYDLLRIKAAVCPAKDSRPSPNVEVSILGERPSIKCGMLHWSALHGVVDYARDHVTRRSPKWPRSTMTRI